MAEGQVYAEDINYWETSRVPPNDWMEKARREIEGAGGTVLAEAFGSDEGGRAAFMLGFSLGGERFRIVWPVLTSKTGKERGARIQAATMLYHDVKARAVAAKVLGSRAAFFSFLLLPDGRTMAQVATPELERMLPRLLSQPYQLEG